MKTYSISWQEERCIGCQACMAACMDEKDLHPEKGEKPGCLVQENINAESAFRKMHICLHCRRPACVQVCAAQALYREEESGLVRFISRRCTGCGRCAESCPIGAVSLDKKGIAHKCDGCAERVQAGLLPACVRACPTKALKMQMKDPDE